MAELPPSIRRNWAASAPQWCAISRLVACHTARSLEAMAVGPGTRRWSLRSFTKTNINRQVRAPIAEMLSRYWIFPYHASPPSPEADGGGGRVEFAIDGDDEGGSMGIKFKKNGGYLIISFIVKICVVRFDGIIQNCHMDSFSDLWV
ncbi:hypothetical protein Fot_08159 [Forsythia ovata]|uniref:Uncharacterized protein n=1 Tax=Forsythia ovata TaxID=205694 RepID=A0ABD1X1Y6_9LAMI